MMGGFSFFGLIVYFQCGQRSTPIPDHLILACVECLPHGQSISTACTHAQIIKIRLKHQRPFHRQSKIATTKSIALFFDFVFNINAKFYPTQRFHDENETANHAQWQRSIRSFIYHYKVAHGILFRQNFPCFLL